MLRPTKMIYNRWLMRALIVMCFVPGLWHSNSSRAEKQQPPRAHSKVAPDLSQRIHSENGNSANVIIQFNETSAIRLDALMTGANAKAMRRLNKLNIRIAKPTHGWRRPTRVHASPHSVSYVENFRSVGSLRVGSIHGSTRRRIKLAARERCVT